MKKAIKKKAIKKKVISLAGKSALNREPTGTEKDFLQLKSELEEHREAVFAIQRGEVEALVVQGKSCAQIFTLENANLPFRTLLESMNEGVATLDASGTIHYCNRRFSEMARQPLEKLTGKLIDDLFSADDRKVFKGLLENGRKNSSKGVVAIESDGVSIPVLFSMRANRVGRGRGISLVATDLTTQRELEGSRSDVDRLNTEKGLRELFVSTLNHDMRNPLSVAKLSAELIARNPDQHDLRTELCKKIIENLNRVDQMIQSLLEADRIRAGEKLILEFSKFSLQDLTKAILEEFTLLHGDRFVLKAVDPVIGFWCCPEIRRAIENLLSNAVKYGTTDTAVVVSLKNKDNQICLTVHNDGPPLTKKEQNNIFEPFERTLDATSGNQRGWGLGLALVRRVAVAHGGKVEVESSRGKGTNFIITLPQDSRSFQ